MDAETSAQTDSLPGEKDSAEMPPRTEQQEQIRARRVAWDAPSMRMQAQNCIIRAEDLLKVPGKSSAHYDPGTHNAAMGARTTLLNVAGMMDDLAASSAHHRAVVEGLEQRLRTQVPHLPDERLLPHELLCKEVADALAALAKEGNEQ